MLEKRLYTIILWCALCLSISSLITNTIGDFTWTVNIKWIVLIIITIFCLILKNSNYSIENTMLIFFLFIILVFVPFSFFDSGGNNSNTLGYSFLVLICIVYLFNEKKRNLLVVIHIIIITSLHIIEYQFPQLVKVYTSKSNFIVNLTQVPIIMIAIYLVTSQFANAYLIQKKKQEKDNKRLETLANYDSVTELYNRRAFNRVLHGLYQSFPESNNVYIAIIDLDYFKHINNQLGHLTGDYVLKSFAYELKKLTHNPNIISRWGGDEFAFLFHGEKQSLEIVLKQMQKAYSKVTSDIKFNTSISIGVALWKNGVSVEEIMKKADIKLYEIKSKGRGEYAFDDN